MKTTFDLPESVLGSLRATARRNRITADALVEEALRALVDADAGRAHYTLPERSVTGRGIRPEIAQDWGALRDAAYGHTA